MKDILVPIDKAGRVVLPKNVREELALKPGDMLKDTIQGNEVILQPKEDKSGFVRRGKALIFQAVRMISLSEKWWKQSLPEEREGRGVEIGRSLSPGKRKQ